MRLISWNVARAGPARITCQVAALAARAPEIIALQEVRINRIPEYRSALARAGFAHIVDGFAGVHCDFQGRRATGVLVASACECTAVPNLRAAMALPWPERLLSVVVATAWGPVELHTVYVPVGYGGQRLDVRVRTLECLYWGLARSTGRHRILCGDFNLPQRETAEGEVITFGQTLRKSGVFAITNALMHQSERAVLLGLAAFGLTDVYRDLHGYVRQDLSWYHPVSGNGFRLDHVLASRSLRAATCRYLDHFRTMREEYSPHGFTRLSDHAALEVVFAPEVHGADASEI